MNMKFPSATKRVFAVVIAGMFSWMVRIAGLDVLARRNWSDGDTFAVFAGTIALLVIAFLADSL